MPKHERKPPKALPDGSVAICMDGDHTKDPEAIQEVNVQNVPGAVYGVAVGVKLKGLFMGSSPQLCGMAYVRDMLDRMKPRDPMEELLITQAALSHARVLHLTALANQQTYPENIRVHNEYADKASNTTRRLILALAEYRKPPRSGSGFTAIKQANIAEQQVVMNGEHSNRKNATNEQGCAETGTSPDLPLTDAIPNPQAAVNYNPQGLATGDETQ